MSLPPRILAIVGDVSAEFGVTLAQMQTSNRSRNVSWPRMIAMWRIRQLPRPPSLPQVGRWFNRDHTTAIHACRRAPVIMALIEERRRMEGR